MGTKLSKTEILRVCGGVGSFGATGVGIGSTGRARIPVSNFKQLVYRSARTKNSGNIEQILTKHSSFVWCIQILSVIKIKTATN